MYSIGLVEARGRVMRIEMVENDDGERFGDSRSKPRAKIRKLEFPFSYACKGS